MSADREDHGYVCRDKGHEFLCRFGPGSCARTGWSSCNAPDEDRDEAGREAHDAVIAESMRHHEIVRSQEDW